MATSLHSFQDNSVQQAVDLSLLDSGVGQDIWGQEEDVQMAAMGDTVQVGSNYATLLLNLDNLLLGQCVLFIPVIQPLFLNHIK